MTDSGLLPHYLGLGDESYLTGSNDHVKEQHIQQQE